ncbi:hypothetical protein D3C79_1034900 [compost metagenome]
MLHGPGEIKGDQFQVSRNRRDRFAVVAGRLENPDWGVLEGFMILPLPLEGAVEAYKAQSSLDRRSRLANRTSHLADSTPASQP